MRAPNAGPLCGPNRLVVALAMVPDRHGGRGTGRPYPASWLEHALVAEALAGHVTLEGEAISSRP